MTKLDLKESPCVFDDASHTYTSKKDGKLWPGVTSIVGLMDKPYLMPWAAKECAEAVKKSRAILLATKDKEQFDAIVDECKGAYRRKSKEALVSGSIAHDFIESHIKAQIEGRWQEGMFEAVTDEKAKSSIEAFLAWEKSHQITWLASELVVGSQTHEFGGKLDALAVIDEAIVLVDFKTSNQISSDYFIQTSAYQIALEEMGQAVDSRLILRIPKDGKDFEALTVPTPYDLDAMTFTALRQVQRWRSFVDNEERGIKDTWGRVKVESNKKVVKI
jgi:hypothetical protein